MSKTAQARSFFRLVKGNVSIIFAAAMLPAMLMIGTGVDYSRALITHAQLQEALDTAVLAGVTQSSTSRNTIANNAFDGALGADTGTQVAASFSTDSSGKFTGSATEQINTSFMQLVKIESMTISATASSNVSTTTSACIVAEANGMSPSQSAITLNGAPNFNLSGCGLQSNASMTCNGHSGNATESIAVGTVSGCNNPEEGASTFSDTYKTLASNIDLQCGSTTTSVSWAAGDDDIPSNVIEVSKGSYTEYHVCGNLTLNGSGDLFSNSQGGVIVVENGDVTVASKADIVATDSTLILTGANSTSISHEIIFPTGKGNLGTLSISAPTSSSNPWQGVAVYVDPSLTDNVSLNLTTGSDFEFSGVAYMPNTAVTISGSVSSAATACSEFVVSSFTSNGAGSIAFAQSTSACQSMNVSTGSSTPYLVD